MHTLLEPWNERKSGIIVPDRNFSEPFLDVNPDEHDKPLVTGITFNLSKGFDYYYERSGHPEYTKLERLLVKAEAPHVKDPEKNIDAAVFSSGMAAISATIDALAKGSDGKKFIAGNTLYTSAKELLQNNVPSNMQPTEFIDTTDPSQVREALERNNGNVVALYFETVTNPTLEFTKIREVAGIAHEFGVPVVVDNTFLSPYLQNPLMMGADIVMHSLTKYASGEGDLLAGAVIGPHEFMNNEGGVKYMRKHKGSALNANDAHLLSERIAGLPIRMEQHCGNARCISYMLKGHEDVERVFYPNLEMDSRAGYAGGVLSFVLRGEDDRERFQRERAFMRFISECGDPVEHRVSFGMPQTLAFGYSNTVPGAGDDYCEVKKRLNDLSIPIGLIRISAGREDDKPELKEAIANAIDYAYER